MTRWTGCSRVCGGAGRRDDPRRVLEGLGVDCGHGEEKTMKAPHWQFFVDRGGTFTDCLGVSPEGSFHTMKVLSSDSAPVEAIEAILAAAGQGEEVDSGRLEGRVKLGTTVATNALLERSGAPTALLTNAGLCGVFDIGTQERP
ncbi:MAG: hypothetical protein CL908_14710, partial [Deltaproteobacteria bacterium]|nr:hypothetical protein [Deltaproteobacteria bacterium]